MRRGLVVGIVVLLLLLGQSLAQQFSYVSIDVPCSAFPNGDPCPNSGYAIINAANGINAAGVIVGSYKEVSAAGASHGFVYRNGQFTTLDVPGWFVGRNDLRSLPTSANGIGPSGDIVGNYTAPVNPTVTDANSAAYCPAPGPACTKGFLYRRGTFRLVLYAGHPGAIPQRITPNGDIYGCLHDYMLMDDMLAARWSSRLGDAHLDVPSSMANGSTPRGDMVVGLWDETLQMTPVRLTHRHGFVIRGGVFQSYDVQRNGQKSTLTAIWDMNPSQAFVGTYVLNGLRHGFLQLPDGSAPIDINFDDQATIPTVAFGINPDGVIVGQYTASGLTHGFAAFPATTD
jgi:hypothetical protein